MPTSSVETQDDGGNHAPEIDVVMTTRPPKYLAPCDVKRPKITPFDNHVARCSNRAGHRGPHFDRAENVRWWTRA